MEWHVYRTSPITDAPGTRCPSCTRPLRDHRSATCADCGLWWIGAPAPERILPLPSEEPILRFVLHLRTHMDVRWLLVTLALGVLASSFVISAFAHPSWFFTSSWSGQLLVLLGLAVCGWIGVSCLAHAVQLLLHAVSPSRLEGDRLRLRVRVWNTWGGLWSGFRRTNALFPREKLRGAALTAGQGGQSQLFVVHASGQAFGTGWSGDEDEGRRLATSFLRWLAARGDDHPCAQSHAEAARTDDVTDAAGPRGHAAG